MEVQNVEDSTVSEWPMQGSARGQSSVRDLPARLGPHPHHRFSGVVLKFCSFQIGFYDSSCRFKVHNETAPPSCRYLCFRHHLYPSRSNRASAAFSLPGHVFCANPLNSPCRRRCIQSAASGDPLSTFRRSCQHHLVDFVLKLLPDMGGIIRLYGPRFTFMTDNAPMVAESWSSFP
jgi:hypothetical protein